MKNTINQFEARLAAKVMAVCLLAVCLIGLAQNGPQGFVGKKINVRDLVLPQLKKTGEKDWVLRAKQGVSSGNSFLLKKVHIVVYRTKKEGGNTELRTSECIYDRSRKIGRGDKPVNIRTGNMVINGEGFDMDGKRKVIVIRSKVRVKIFNNDRNLLGTPAKDDKKPLDKPAKNDKKRFVKPAE